MPRSKVIYEEAVLKATYNGDLARELDRWGDRGWKLCWMEPLGVESGTARYRAILLKEVITND